MSLSDPQKLLRNHKFSRQNCRNCDKKMFFIFATKCHDISLFVWQKCHDLWWYVMIKGWEYYPWKSAQIATNAVSRQNCVCLWSSLSMSSFARRLTHFVPPWYGFKQKSRDYWYAGFISNLLNSITYIQSKASFWQLLICAGVSASKKYLFLQYLAMSCFPYLPPTWAAAPIDRIS